MEGGEREGRVSLEQFFATMYRTCMKSCSICSISCCKIE